MAAGDEAFKGSVKIKNLIKFGLCGNSEIFYLIREQGEGQQHHSKTTLAGIFRSDSAFLVFFQPEATTPLTKSSLKKKPETLQLNLINPSKSE